jgi:tRNA(Ile)-lysidine synthase TilS/MesJ
VFVFGTNKRRTNQNKGPLEMPAEVSPYDVLRIQAQELGFDEVTLILSQRDNPNAIILRSNIETDERIAVVLGMSKENVFDRVVAKYGSLGPLTDFIAKRRARKKACPPPLKSPS